MSMFCYQCEQTAKGTGCTVQGVCGKDETCAILQDLLLYAVKGIAQYAHRARQLGATHPEVNAFTVEALFATITNVDFDPERLENLLRHAAGMRLNAKRMYEDACRKAGKTPESLSGPAAWSPAVGIKALVEQGRDKGILARTSNGATTLRTCTTWSSSGSKAWPRTPTTRTFSAKKTMPSTPRSTANSTCSRRGDSRPTNCSPKP